MRKNEMDKISGSMEVLSSLQITADTAGLDQASKEIYKNKEVLAVILKGVVKEFEPYSYEEIMDFIEADSITGEEEVSPGRTNTKIQGGDKEFTALNEKVSIFDTKLKAVNPKLSDEKILVNLHIDIEPQKTYRPGYPIEKRGMYYLARELGAQLSLVTDNTDYNSLEKCYSIWICRDDIPKKERFSISFMEMCNTTNYGNCQPDRKNYDLLTLIIIRLGDEVYNKAKEEPGYDVLKFLHAVMYPHKKDFLDTVKEYIDFSQNETLWKEMDRMSGLGMSVLLEGEARGEARGVTLGVTLSAQIFKIIQSGETDNNVIAEQCACSVAQVEEIRRAFGI